MKHLLLSLSLFFLMGGQSQAVKLYLLSNHGNAGDHNQTLGIAAALEKHSHQKVTLKDLDTKLITPSEIKAEIDKDLLQEKVIVVGSGEGGIEGIKDLSPQSNLIICLTSHMFLKDFQDPALLQKVTFIALPIHETTSNQEILKEKLIKTVGVSHNRQAETADKIYGEWKKVLPTCKEYLGVVLGGDAPTPSKEIKLFTEHDATKLATYIAQHAQNACVLVLNGPRTGKYGTDNKEIMTVHRQGQSDSITKFFQQSLAAQGIKNVKFFDFQHNNPENKAWVLPYNSFDLVVGAVKATHGKMLIPGESTSMISEAIDVLPSGHVLVYENNPMNEVHSAHVTSELAAGRIAVLQNYRDVLTPKINAEGPKPSAAQVIAQQLWETVNQPENVGLKN